MNRSHLFRLGCALGSACTLLGGCGPGSDGLNKTFGLFGRSANDTNAAGQSKQPSGGVRIVDLAFEVRRAEIVQGDLQHSRKIWNHVDELRLGVDSTAGLARNGFRIGAASPGTWPAITAVLTAAGARVETRQLVTQTVQVAA